MRMDEASTVKKYTTFVEIFVYVMLSMAFCELHVNFSFRLFDLNPPILQQRQFLAKWRERDRVRWR
jgi:hypothetical protein